MQFGVQDELELVWCSAVLEFTMFKNLHEWSRVYVPDSRHLKSSPQRTTKQQFYRLFLQFALFWKLVWPYIPDHSTPQNSGLAIYIYTPDTTVSIYLISYCIYIIVLDL